MEKAKKLHNAKLWAIFTMMFVVCFQSIYGLVNDPTWIELVLFCVSIGWLTMFEIVNTDRCKGE